MDRLRQRADFLLAATAVKAPAAGFVLQVRDRRDGNAARIGFTVSKKVGNAVVRNRVRRRLREVVRQSAAGSMRVGHDYVVVGRHAAIALPFERLTEDFYGALRRAHEGRRDRRPGRAGPAGNI